MDYQSIAKVILGTMEDAEWSLRDRLYAVLTGPILAVGPPWPEDPEAYRLLGVVDAKMRRIQAGLPADSKKVGGVIHMLDHMPDEEIDELAAAVLQFAERLAEPPGDLPRGPGGETVQ